jgi:hypothetical protein
MDKLMRHRQSTKLIIDCVEKYFELIYLYVRVVVSLLSFGPLLPDQQAIFHHQKPKMTKQPTWFITRTSSGLGEAFALKILARGDRVIATAGTLSKIQHLKSAGAKILELDVTTSRDVIDAKAREAIAIYGTVDLVVNNAGTAILGTIEEAPYDKWVEQHVTSTECVSFSIL